MQKKNVLILYSSLREFHNSLILVATYLLYFLYQVHILVSKIVAAVYYCPFLSTLIGAFLLSTLQ